MWPPSVCGWSDIMTGWNNEHTEHKTGQTVFSRLPAGYIVTDALVQNK